ncbi:MAG: glycosyltransferase [Firmicutes bacterium]|nr:glycosyltransferase [Bacillota bacterium]
MVNRLLVLSASIGAGHLKAAEAVCRAFKDCYPEKDAVHVDFLKYCDPVVSKLLEESYYFLTSRLAWVYGFIYEKEKRRPEPLVKKEQVLLAIGKYKKFLDEYRPDLIVSTHFFPAAVVSYYYPKYPVPNGVILTDYASHPMWVYPHVGRYFVACREMVDELWTCGVDREKIKVTGIPIRPEFGLTFSTDRLRAEKGLPQDQPVILVMSGGNAIGPLMEILEVLNRVPEDFTAVVITGKNEKTRRALAEAKDNFHFTLHLPGYVDDMHKWMRLADFLISKAGGLTVSEALAVGLPMLVVRPTPGQEEANTEFLLKAGAGYYLKDLEDLQPVVQQLLKDPAKLEELRENAAKLGKAGAATEIIKELVILGETAKKSACSNSVDLL